MIRFALIVIASIFWSAFPATAAEVTQAEMQIMIAELYKIEKKIGPEEGAKERINHRNKIIQSFVGIGKPAMPILIEALNDTTRYGFVRRSAAEAIGKINDPAAIPSLHTLLKVGNIPQRQGAAEALGNLKSRASVQTLIEALNKDSYQGVRMLAAIALGEIGDKSAINSLAERVRNRKEDLGVRAYAALSLGALKATTKVRLLLTILEEEHQKSPGGSLAEYCDRALRLITEAKIDYYSATHIPKERQDKIIKEWWHWWETEGKLKYPQS